MIHLDVDAFVEFCEQLTLPSRDAGLVPMRFFGTQRYWIEQIAEGLREGVHDFVTLKGGRQIGGSTIADAMALYWPQSNPGTQGMVVSDDDDNRNYRRDILLSMNQSLPRAYRRPLARDNATLARWDNGSRMSFRAAGKRQNSNLGRSRGVSFLHADEIGSWPDQGAISALRASLSEQNPQRLYLWNSTARGIGTPFHEMWRTAETAVSQRAIFLAWWRHEGYSVPRSRREFWAQYGDPPTADEQLWMDEVQRRYRVTITMEQLVWYRWKLAEGMGGDETMMAQEFGSLPEECFQSWGDKFVGPRYIRRARIGLASAPTPVGYTYDFLDTIDETAQHGVREIELSRVDPLRTQVLRVWQEPRPDAVYVVAGHPAHSSSETAREHIAMVFRVWPDKMLQVAEFISPHNAIAMYQFAWIILHLSGAYRTFVPAYSILDVAGAGRSVLAEIQLLERYGYGASPRAKWQIQDFLGSVRHYFYKRPDVPFARSRTQEWHTQPNTRGWILHGLKNTIERGQMTLRSPELIDNLSALRQGESGDYDVIAGGAGLSDSLAVCAALAVECWLRSAIPELEGLIAPSELRPDEPSSVQQRILQTYLGDVLTRGGRTT